MNVPLLLDGSAETNLRQRGMNADDCVSQWILSHADTAGSLYENCALNGSDILCTPTASSNRTKLKQYGLDDCTEEINRNLCSLVKQYCKNGIKMAGVVSTTAHMPKPFGDADFRNLFRNFLEQAYILKNSGADMLWVQAMTSLSEMRAAIFACKQTGLPVYASISLESDGKTNSGASPLSCLICVQALGVSGFGFEYSDADVIAEAVKEIAPYATVPIIARPDAGLEDLSGNYNIPTGIFTENALKCIENGASFIGGGDGTSFQHIMALRHIIDEQKIYVPEIEKYDDSCQIIVSNASQTFFLNTDSIETSKPLRCSQDMADEIIEINESSLDVVTIELNNCDDALLFSINSNLVSLPVMFTSSNRTALETALFLYDGKALIDSGCDIDEDILKHIEKQYGALIY